MPEVAGGPRQEPEQALLGSAVNSADRDPFAAKPGRGQGDEKAPDRRLAVGEVGKAGVDHRSAGKAERFEARLPEPRPNPAGRRRAAGDCASRFGRHASRPLSSTRGTAAAKSLTKLGRQFHRPQYMFRG